MKFTRRGSKLGWQAETGFFAERQRSRLLIYRQHGRLETFGMPCDTSRAGSFGKARLSQTIARPVSY
jgi:hypothetical protein